MNKLIKKILDVIFIIIILILASYFILRMNKVVEVYNVRTGSMEDNIHVGDYVLILRKKGYEIGDVVTFKKDDFFVTHRIIKKSNNMFVTKGDANNEEDGPITHDQIVGKVIIIGGFLNIVIRYKYFLASIFISLYLLSCYLFGESENEEKLEETKIVEETTVTENKPKRGRPRKTSVDGEVKTTTRKRTSTSKKKAEEVVDTENKPKRGRPRKTTVDGEVKTTTRKRTSTSKKKVEEVVDTENKPKRGRPRKTQTESTETIPKPKRGRPRKKEIE